jgi:N-methylhydantoinase A
MAGREFSLQPLSSVPASSEALKGERPAWSPAVRAMVPHAVYDRARLAPDTRLTGPAIVEEPESTTVIGVGGSLEVDAYGTLVITLGEESA